MTNPLTRQLLEFERRLAKLEAGARTSQLQNASITGTAITVYDEDGETPLQYIGKQGDGTVGTVAVNGPVPPAPSPPALSPGQLSLTVSWDGTFVDEDGDAVPRPADVEGVQVHVSTSTGFTPDSSTLRGLLSVAGDLVVQPLSTEPHHVVLVAVTSSAVLSEPSGEAVGTPDVVVPGAGTITETMITDGSITTPKIATNAITSDLMAANSILAGMITAGAVGAEQLTGDAIDGKVITGATIRTISTDSGFFVYDGEPTLGTLIISIAAAAGVDDFGNSYPKGLSVNEGSISGLQIVVEPGDQGVFVYGAVPVVETFTTPGSGSWVAPAGVTSVFVECWGGGGGGDSVPLTGGGGGGGGGEYAAEMVAVTPGNSYAYVVGAGGLGTNAAAGGGFDGQNSSFGTTTVVAHGGSAGLGTAGGAGGTGSSNTVHFDGGAGGAGSTSPDTPTGGGGGSSAGPDSPGNPGSPLGGPGGTAPLGGGAGASGWTAVSGAALPGSSPGGGGTSLSSGGSGAVRLTAVGSTPELIVSIAGNPGVDSFGTSYPRGLHATDGHISGTDIVFDPSAGTLWAYKQ